MTTGLFTLTYLLVFVEISGVWKYIFSSSSFLSLKLILILKATLWLLSPTIDMALGETAAKTTHGSFDLRAEYGVK